MRIATARRWAGWRRALIVLVIGVLLVSGTPLAAWAVPTPTPTPSPDSLTAQDEAKAATATPTPSPTPTPTASPKASASPTDDEPASPEPTEPSKDAEPTPEESESASITPTASASPSPSASTKGRVVAQAVPVPTGNNAVITVKVGGNRTTQRAVGNLAGVTLGFYANATGGAELFSCTSDADGDCSITVPNTQGNGANRDARYYVRQTGTAANYYQNPQLGTGAVAGADPYVFRTGDRLRSGTTYTSATDFMISAGTTNLQASGGVWQNSRNNPSFPAKCGINVAILHDLSNSVTAADLTQMKAASSGFVDALVGTPSQVSTFTFASNAPAAGAANATLPLASVSTAAGAAVVKNRINGMALPGRADGATNWDRGIYQVAQAAASFDVLVVITDGNPTYYGDQVGAGNLTRFREIENGIFSANAIKAEGTKVIAFGVGGGVSSAGSGLNLRSISGPTAGTDYYQTTDYAAAGTQLKNLAQGNCQGSISVIKQVVPNTTATGSTAGAQPTGGWAFAGAGSAGVSFDAPTSRTTAGVTGAANFPLTFSGGTTSGTVTLTETPQDNFALHQGVTGQNAVCTRIDTGATVASGNVTNGFTVAANSTYPISCTVYNKAPSPLASVVVNKQWRINGTDYAEGSQPTNFVAGALIAGTDQGWGVERTGFRAGDRPIINEAITNVPIQCTVTSRQVVLANGATVTQPVPYTPTLVAGQNTYTIRNVVDCRTRLTLTKTVNGGTEPVSSWTLNAPAPSGALPGPTGTSGAAGATGVEITPNVTYPLAESATTTSALNYTQFVNPTATLIAGATGSWTCQEVGTDGTTVIPGYTDGINGGVRVPIGKWVRCTAVNRTSTLVLRKVVQNTRGGTAVPANWSLTATPTGTFPAGLPAQTVTGSPNGASINVRPDVSYQISESTGRAGYTLASTVCDTVPGSTNVTSIAVATLDTATCTFTNVDTPATLTLVKNVINDNGGTAARTAWTLNAAGPTPISGVHGSTAVTSAPVNAGSYALSETNGPAGYVASAWSCTGGTVSAGTVTVANGADVTCTITNNDTAPRLTLVKNVINDNGGTATAAQWTLAAAGPTPLSGISGTTAVTNAAVNAGTYTLSESGGPAGYTASSWTCTGAITNGTTVTLVTGGDATCTITNNDRTGALTLVKTVTNDNGGQATRGQWTLAAAGPTPISGITGAATVTGAVVNAGTYTLSESGGPAGYTASPWTCTGATSNGTTVTVPTGGDVTCTINNNDQAAQLTLRKIVDNGTTGGTALATAWTLTATGPTTGVSGTTGSGPVTGATVNAGNYALTETGGPTGYTASAWTCTGGTLTGSTVTVANGGNATCTITNTAQQTRLTLVKTVTNNSGGTAANTAWTLNAVGPTTGISGATGTTTVTNVAVNPGTYALTETAGPAGYTPGAWVCTSGSLTGASLTLAQGQNATCTINNDDQPATLTLVKTVVNDNGGTAAATAWTLNATGPTTGVTGATGTTPVTNVTVNAGGYTLTETGGPAGYTASAWTCAGGTLTGTTIAVTNGATVRCTITNNDIAPRLTLVKNVVNGTTGATAAPADWTLRAAGPTPISGPGNSAAVTAQVVDAGTYALTEAGGPAGYTASTWSCTGGILTGASVAVALGGDVTCTITNTAQQATLTLVKNVINNNGGTAAATAWTLNAVGPTTGVTGGTGSTTVTNVPVSPGAYALTETNGPTGYTASAWTCTSGAVTGSTVTVALGADVTCTITNNDQPATLTLVKTVVNGASGADAVPADWTLRAAGPTTVNGAGNSAAVTNQTVDAGSYALTETGGPTGYTASEWTCTGGALTGATVVVPNGGTVTCRITNTATAPTLTLVKVVDNGTTGATTAAAAWTLTADGPTTIEGAAGSPAVTSAAAEIGTYDLSEDGPDGYDASDWVCTGATATTADSVTLGLNQNATCTITNTAEQPTLTLVKTVTNNSGGSAPRTAWTLTATGPTTGITGPFGSPAVTDADVAVGDYVLSESGGPAGYTAGDWSCTGGSLTGSTVTVALGDDVTCTINNNDQPATLTLVKVVDPNGSGTTRVPAEWNLTADPQDIEGQAAVTGNGDPTTAGGVNNVSVYAGAYELSEAGPNGFDGSLWECTGGTVTGDIVTIANGGNVTCTITNTAIAPRVTLVKQVVNDNGGTAVVGDWTLSADGPSPVSGATGTAAVTDAAVAIGTYELDETGPTGYTPSAWTCVDGTTPFPVTDATITLAEGDDVTCTITNNDVLGSWTLAKSSDPVSGTTVQPGDEITYTLTATKTGGVNPVNRIVTDNLTDVLNNATLVGTPTVSTGTASVTGSTLTWSIPSLTGTQAVTYTVRVNPGAYGVTLRNAATGTDSSTCTPAAPCTTTHPTPHYTLVKSSDPASGTTVNPGATVAYTLTATNDSAGTVTGAVVTDNLADVLDNAALGTVGPGGSVAGTTLTWTVPTLAPGATAQLTYVVTVNADAYDATLRNVATPGPGGQCVVASDCTTTHPTPHYTLTKTSNPVSGTTVNPGATVTYTLTATNDSAGTVTGAVVTDNLADVLDNAALGTVGPGGSVAGTTLTWTVPTLAPGATAQLTYAVTVNADAYDATLRNVATPGPGGECVVPGNCTTTHPTPHYTLTKTSDPVSGTAVRPGDTITYTLTATNDSQATLTGGRVTDNLADVLDNATLGVVGAGGSVTGTTLTWNLPTLQPGADATLTYTVRVNAGANGVTLRNVATPGPGGECVPASDCTTTHPTPHWVINKTSDPVSGATVQPGDIVTYTLTALNDSTVTVSDATATDDLSDVLDDATLGAVGTGATVAGTTLTWAIPTLAPGARATVTYSVTVADGAYHETLRNVVTPGVGGDCRSIPAIQPASVDGTSARAAGLVTGQAAADCTTTHPTPGWTLAKSSDPESGSIVDPGDQVTYYLTVSNDSDGVVDDAVVTDDLTDVLRYASLDAVPAGATLSGNTLTWNVPSVAPGTAAELSYTVTVDDDAYDVSFDNVATPGDGGDCTSCTTTHETPPKKTPANPDQPTLPDTGGPSLVPLGLGAGLVLAGVLVLAESRRRRLVPVRIDPET